MPNVVLSQSVLNDFQQAKNYKISLDEAEIMMGKDLNQWYQFALKKGWTQEKTLNAYFEHEHGAIVTAAFLKRHRIS